MLTFEFLDYGINPNSPEITTREYRSESAARSHAGALAKRNGGPVDLAHVKFLRSWNERYITTAIPSDYHKSGYCFERIDG